MIGYPHTYFRLIDSTHEYASSLVSKSRPTPGTAISAGFQTAGKGQLGRNWQSAEGENLLMSVIWYPNDLRVARAFGLNMLCSVAITSLLSDFGIENATIKWPNDILINKSKIAGILVRNSVRGAIIQDTVVSVGLNVNQTSFPKINAEVISMKSILEATFTIEHIRRCLCEQFSNYFPLLNDNLDSVKKEYLSRLYGFNTEISYTTSSGSLRGRIADVKDDGTLVIQDLEGNKIEFSRNEI